MDSQSFDFDVETTVHHQTGRIIVVYLRVRKGKPAKTKEFNDGDAFADYDRRGRLLGIELLAPTRVKIVDQIATEPRIRKWVREAAPRAMVQV